MHSKKVSPLTIATTRQATKSTTMAMAQQDTTTTTSMDVEVDDDNTASSKAASRQEVEEVLIFPTRQPAGENEEEGSRMDA